MKRGVVGHAVKSVRTNSMCLEMKEEGQRSKDGGVDLTMTGK